MLLLALSFLQRKDGPINFVKWFIERKNIIIFVLMKRGNYKHMEEMRSALWEAYSNVYRKCWTQREAWERTSKQPAPRFFVSPKQARLVLAPMLRGDFSKMETMTKDKQRMYRHLYDLTLQFAQKPEFLGKSLNFIVSHVVSSPAPEFYIGWECVRKAMRVEKRKRMKNGRICTSN